MPLPAAAVREELIQQGSFSNESRAHRLLHGPARPWDLRPDPRRADPLASLRDEKVGETAPRASGLELNAQKAADKELIELVGSTGASLLDLRGIGPSGAARMLVEVVAEPLAVAITGRGAFRRFKDTLSRWPDPMTRWHGFSAERQRGRARQWLADYGYRPAAPRI